MYYKKCYEYHPDRTGGMHQDKFKAINVAYDILRNQEKRKEYDQARNMRGNQSRTSQPTSTNRQEPEDYTQSTWKADNFYNRNESKNMSEWFKSSQQTFGAGMKNFKENFSKWNADYQKKQSEAQWK